MTIEMSRDFYKAIRKRIEVEEDHITYYQQLLQLQLTYFERQETKALIYGAIYRVLYLFSIDDADKMMPLIPLILESVSEEEFSGFFQKELELLDNYLRHSKDRSFLSHLFEEPKLTIPPEVLLSKQKMGPWLTQVFSAKILTHQGVAMHDLEKLVVLRGCNLFKTLSADILLVLANRMQVELIAKDTILFTEGDISGDLYIIAEGNIVISHSGQIIGYKEKFDFVGELSLLDDKPRTATAAAMTDAVVLKMAKIEYDRILDDFPDLLRTIVQTLLGYLRKVQPLAVQK